jgi:aminoglycoside phosphotransferase (APT) family kinase protein
MTQVPNDAAQDSLAGLDEQAAFVTDALRSAEALAGGELISRVEQLSGGWSRHSHVARTHPEAGGERQFIIRVEAPGGVLETDIAAEYALYHALDAEPEIRTPHVYYFDGTGDNPFGHRLMIMEHVAGSAANAFRRGDRTWLAEDWNGPKGIAIDMVENLARLHSLPADRLPAGTVPELGFLDVVERWQTVYEEKHLVRDPVTEEGFRWLRARVPPDVQRGIVHGDYRIGNALVEHGRLTALLDWELAYVGDVRFDLGYLALERLAGKHLRPVTHLLNAFADPDWFFEQYARLTGRPVDREVVRTFSVLGIMMLLSTHYMGIWMYQQGRSTDFRLAWNRFGAIGLRQDLTELMEW